jgi:hypothetical protein
MAGAWDWGQMVLAIDVKVVANVVRDMERY